MTARQKAASEDRKEAYRRMTEGSAILECVPNFSEGRRRQVVAQIEAAAASVLEARVLDRHSDADHNRTVLTLAGGNGAVAEAAFRTAAAAVKLIDVRDQVGVHPRMGSIDVIPFAPLRGATLEQAAVAARQVATRIGQELRLPAYLYGAAAMPGRPTALHAIRGDGFESLAQLGDRLPAPDAGPSHLHTSAGAVAVGARPVLIAFNVIVDTQQREVPRHLARAVRASSRGLPMVEAMGLWLPDRGVAQVSMNLLDYRVTGIAEVLARLREAAAREGVELTSAELVGLAPAQALAGLEGESLPGIPGSEQTIEARLAARGLG